MEKMRNHLIISRRVDGNDHYVASGYMCARLADNKPMAFLISHSRPFTPDWLNTLRDLMLAGF